MHDNATALERALSRLRKRTTFGDHWLVTTGAMDLRYRHISIDGRLIRNHIFAWFAATGRWPQEGEHVCHTCDIQACWRNDEVGTYEVGGIVYERRGHLWLGNTRANMLDKFFKGRAPAGNDHHTRRHSEAVCQGSRHGRSKLTEQDVLDIRRRWAAGESQQSLANAYRIGVANISYIVLRKTWRHLL